MKAVILCGGQGTRIRDANDMLPKPMLPIGGKPILWHIMKGFATHGVTDFVLCLGYKGWLIKEFFVHYRAMTTDITVQLGKAGDIEFHGRHGEEMWNVTLAETGENSNTGDRIRAIRRYVEPNFGGHVQAMNDEFLLTYGDGVSDVNIAALVAFHRAQGKIATVTAVRPPGRFGELAIDNGVVREFNEKPQTTEGFVNGGFFVCDSKRIWSHLEGENVMFEREPLQRLTHENELAAYEHQGFWQPMDTLREYKLLNDVWTDGKAPWKTWK